jgi:hypothetical protein
MIFPMIICIIPIAMIIASFFLDEETMEWKNPFRKESDDETIK